MMQVTTASPARSVLGGRHSDTHRSQGPHWRPYQRYGPQYGGDKVQAGPAHLVTAGRNTGMPFTLRFPTPVTTCRGSARGHRLARRQPGSTPDAGHARAEPGAHHAPAALRAPPC